MDHAGTMRWSSEVIDTSSGVCHHHRRRRGLFSFCSHAHPLSTHWSPDLHPHALDRRSPLASSPASSTTDSDACEIQTPAFWIPTSCGAIPWLTEDVAQRLFRAASCADADDDAEDVSLSRHARIFSIEARDLVPLGPSKETPPSLCLLPGLVIATPFGYHQHTTSAHATEDAITMETHCGRRTLSVEEWCDVCLSSSSLDAVSTLCDVPPCRSGKRRYRSALSKIPLWIPRHLSRCSTKPLLASFCASSVAPGELEAILALLEKHMGTELRGVHIICDGSSEQTPDVLSTIEQVKRTITHTDFPIFVSGISGLCEMLDVLASGADVVQTLHPFTMAASGKFYTFPTSLHENVLDEDMNDEDLAKLLSSFPPAVTNVKDPSFEQDASVFSPYQHCSQHTRAYLHHLFATDEMLGPILLTMHNLVHIEMWMTSFRKSIEASQSGIFCEFFRLYWQQYQENVT